MKFFGQGIYDLISRFRNDVFLEDVSSGTIVSGGHLGLDSNNKIVKASVSSSTGDIEGVTAGTGLSGGGTSGTVTLNVSGLSISEIASGSLTTSSETFEDNDNMLMTAAAINDRIESFGYTTNTGDITSVQLTTDSGNVSTASGDVNHEIAGGNAISTAVTAGKIVINHDDTSSQASVNNSGRTYIQDITLDTYGHVTALTSATEDVTDTNTNQLTEFTLTGDSGSNQTIAHGNTLDIAGGNAISTVVGATDTVTINHDDTSSQASVNNSGRTFIQDITLDTYGHVTGITSATDSDTHVGDITSVTAGTGLSGGGNSGDVTLNVSNLALAQFNGDVITTSSESFSDDDNTLMTSAAINDRIQSFGFTSNTGDITGVRITTDDGGSPATASSGSADFNLLGSNGVGITNSGSTTITAVAVPGEIDHDSLLNFVAAEHYRWDTDISSTATINAANIPTLNQNTTGNAATATALTSGNKTISGDLTVTSGTSGDATLIISADTDNNNENDNARLWFKQDGDITEGAIQMTSNVMNIINNVNGLGGISFQTGSTNNTGTTDPSTNAAERMLIASDGDVIIEESLQVKDTLKMGTNDFANSSGVIQVATQGTIDHDSLANFVANEHIDWTGASAGTIHASNIPTLNQDTTGNAATATKLAATKTIAGVAFDGSANISLNNNAITNGAGYTTNTGDIDSVRFTTDDGSAASVSSGNASFTISGGEGIDTSASGTTVTIAGENATTSNKGVASFEANHFEVDNGAVSLKAVAVANYSLVSCSGTVTTSTTAGEGNAVVIPYDTEDLVSSNNTVILTGSSGLTGISGSSYAWYSETQGDWEYQWNVLSNTNIVNNRILNGVKLQRGTHNGSTMTWTDYDPSTSFIYDRGTGTVRKGSTTNQTLVTQGGTQYYWRLVVWKEAASNASMNAITVVTGVSLIVKQIS